MWRIYSFLGLFFCWLSLAMVFPDMALAQNVNVPGVNIALTPESTPQQTVFSLQLLLLFTVLALAPTFLVMMTPFTRIIIVLGFLRQALGTQQSPPNQVLVGIAFFMTLFITMPMFKEANTQAVQPFLQQKITQEQAFERGLAPFRQFMLKQVRQDDLELYLRLSKSARPKMPEDVATHVLIPAFTVCYTHLTLPTTPYV